MNENVKRVALIADCIDLISGVSTTSYELLNQSSNNLKTQIILVGTCTTNITSNSSSIRYISSRFSLPLGGYKGYKIGFPIFGIIKELNNGKYDYFHVFTPGMAGILAIYIAKRKKIKVIYSHHTRLEIFIQNSQLM